MKFNLPAVALAIGLLATGCHGSSEPTPVERLFVTPTSATLSLKQSKIFQVKGGHEPYTVQAVGCLGGAMSCISINLSDSHVGDVGAPFTLENLGLGRYRLTFIDARLQPVNTRLTISDTSPDVSKFGDNTYAELHLVY